MKEKRLLEQVSDIYIFLIIILFPLIVDKTGFFHILECKWNAYVMITTTYIITNILIVLYYKWIKKKSILKKEKISIIQWLAILFLIVNILSYLVSPFRKNYNLLIGVGRGEGLIVSSLYILSFLFLTLFAKFKKKHILYFSISSILLNTIAILQFLGFNPLNMYQDGIGIHNVSFLTTIGNIDFVSALYCILVSISFSAYVFLEKNSKWEKVIHISSIFMSFMMIAIMQVASGKLAPFLTLIIIFPFIIVNHKRMSRLIVIVATILLAYCTNLVLNPEYHHDEQRYALYFNINYIVVLMIIISIIMIYLSRVLLKTKYDYSNNKKIIKRFYYSLGLIGFTSLIVLFFYKPNIEMLSEIHELLHGNFDDNFGTYRIFLWKRTLKIFPDYWLLGSGPDSFAIRFMAKYTQDIAALGELTINDTAANIYLTMAINLGVLGLGTYLGFLYSQVKIGIQKMNKESKILLIGILCYAIQSFFNLSVVIVSPVFWVLMALHHNCIMQK